MRRGRLIVVAGPSGVGKGTVVRRLLDRDPAGLVYSVSATTRAPRDGEIDGTHYRFVTDQEFDRLAGSLHGRGEVAGLALELRRLAGAIGQNQRRVGSSDDLDRLGL